MCNVPWWVKAILILKALRDFFIFEKAEGKSFRKPVRSFRHMNPTTGRLERTYGAVFEVGSQVYTLYYRLWFRPFEVRDWPTFDAFSDPYKGGTVFLDPWSKELVNPTSGKRVPFEALGNTELLKELQ